MSVSDAVLVAIPVEPAPGPRNLLGAAAGRTDGRRNDPARVVRVFKMYTRRPPDGSSSTRRLLGQTQTRYWC